jgi:hypothetical protein
MAGFHQQGTPYKTYPHKVPKAYCEGMTARIGNAITVNPYTLGTDEYAAWAAGHDAAAADAGGKITNAESCAVDISATIPV